MGGGGGNENFEARSIAKFIANKWFIFAMSSAEIKASKVARLPPNSEYCMHNPSV